MSVIVTWAWRSQNTFIVCTCCAECGQTLMKVTDMLPALAEILPGQEFFISIIVSGFLLLVFGVFYL